MVIVYMCSVDESTTGSSGICCGSVSGNNVSLLVGMTNGRFERFGAVIVATTGRRERRCFTEGTIFNYVCDAILFSGQLLNSPVYISDLI